MMNLVFALRDARWLGADRAIAWARVISGVAVLCGLLFLLVTRGGSGPDPWHRPLATDFVSFWTAAKLAVAGQPDLAWEPAAHAAAQHANFPRGAGFESAYYAFFYPPPFLLICLPFALLPYGAAVVVWVGLTGTASLF